MPDSALFSVSVSSGSCVSGKKTLILSNLLGIPSNYFSNQRLTLKLTIGTMNSSFRNAWFRTFFRFCKLRQLRVWKKTITLSNVLGIPSSYFSNQRLKLKLTTGTMNSSFRNAWFRTFFPFLQVEAVACLEKNNNSIQRARNTFKLLFKSKIKVEINHWDHEFQFPECLIPHLFPFLQAQAVACQEKNINSGPMFSEYLQVTFQNQRLTLKLTIGTMNSSFRNAWFRTFFQFLQAQAVACQEKKTLILSKVLGIPSSYFSKSKINVEINHWDHEFQFPVCLIPHFFPFL